MIIIDIATEDKTMAASKTYDIKITVESVAGKCPRGNKPGDQFIVNGSTPGGMCLGAFGALLPAIQTLRYGGGFPWEKNPNEAHIGCPDHINSVVYRLERIVPSDK